MTVHLPAHGVAALLLNDDGPEPEYLDGSCAVYYQCSVRYFAGWLASRLMSRIVAKWNIYIKLSEHHTFTLLQNFMTCCVLNRYETLL
jgi:hypothetical protein